MYACIHNVDPTSSIDNDEIIFSCQHTKKPYSIEDLERNLTSGPWLLYAHT